MRASVLSSEQKDALDTAVLEAVTSAANVYEARNRQIRERVEQVPRFKDHPALQSAQWLTEIDHSLQRLKRAGKIHFHHSLGWSLRVRRGDT